MNIPNQSWLFVIFVINVFMYVFAVLAHPTSKDKPSKSCKQWLKQQLIINIYVLVQI